MDAGGDRIDDQAHPHGAATITADAILHRPHVHRSGRRARRAGRDRPSGLRLELHPASADRQSAAFAHGVGLAAILAAVLAAGRVAQWLDGEIRRVWPGVIGIVATIAVLAHLADDWSAGSAAVRSVHILLVHAAPARGDRRRGLDRPAGSRPRAPAGPRSSGTLGGNPRPIPPAYNLPHDGVCPAGVLVATAAAVGGASAVALGRTERHRPHGHHHPPGGGAGARERLVDLDRPERRRDLPPRRGRRRGRDRDHVRRSATRSTPALPARRSSAGARLGLRDRPPRPHPHERPRRRRRAVGHGRLPQGRHLPRERPRRRPHRRRRRARRADGAALAARPAAARHRALGAGRRPGGRDRQPARRVPQHHRRGSSRPSAARSTRSSPATRSTTRSRPTPRSTTATRAAR